MPKKQAQTMSQARQRRLFELPGLADRAEEAESESMPLSASQRLDKERWKAARYASIVALAPPLFVLALGSALIWALGGFR
jgi:hypothetical protein